MRCGSLFFYLENSNNKDKLAYIKRINETFINHFFFLNNTITRLLAITALLSISFAYKKVSVHI